MFGWLIALLTVCAPAPAGPPPDPFARGYLGVRVQTGELTVTQVEPRTPADRAGIRAGDVLVKVGTHTPQSFDTVVTHITSFRPGTELRVVVRRGAETKQFTVRLIARPATAGPTIFVPED